MRVFVVQRRDNDALCKVGPNPVTLAHSDAVAWSHDIREAALFHDENRAVKCREAVKAAGIEARVMVLSPQPW